VVHRLVPDGGSTRAARWAPLAWMKQVICRIHGHDYLLRVRYSRMFLHCTSCGHETPGWWLR
jgi:hypothetical protein